MNSLAISPEALQLARQLEQASTERKIPPRWPTSEARIEFDEIDTQAGGDASWTVSFLDVLLLLVTLFAVLLGMTYLQTGDPITTTAEETASPATPTPVALPHPALALAEVLPTYLGSGPERWGSFIAFPYAMGGPIWEATQAVTEATNLTPVASETRHTGTDAGATPSPWVTPERPMLSVAGPLPWDTGFPESYESPSDAYAATDPGNHGSESVASTDNAWNALITWANSDAQTARLDAIATDQQLRLELGDAILFPSGSADLNTSGQRLLAELAEQIRTMATEHHLRVSVEGHTDDVPIQTARFPSNWELSSLRATTVARELMNLGISESMLRIAGYADTRPRAPNDSASNRALNRRVSIVVQLQEG